MSPIKEPMHVGEFLKEAYLVPMNYSITGLASTLGVSPTSISRLVNKKAGLTYSMAVKLEKQFGRTAESWMNLQTAYGLKQART